LESDHELVVERRAMRMPRRATVAEKRGAHGRKVVAGKDDRHSAVDEVARLLRIGELLELRGDKHAVDPLAGLAVSGGDREVEIVGDDRDAYLARPGRLGGEGQEVAEDSAGAAFMLAREH